MTLARRGKTDEKPFAVEEGVPIPEIKRGRRDYTSKYPFRDLEVGESFFVPDRSKKASLGGYCTRMGNRLGRKFTLRVIENGVRVWRTE